MIIVTLNIFTSFNIYGIEQQSAQSSIEKGAAPDISVGKGPFSIAVNPTTNKIYVAE